MDDVTNEPLVQIGGEELVRNWGLIALRGVAALIFGLVTIFSPGIGLLALVLLFGAYALVDGILAVGAALSRKRPEHHWVAVLIGGVLSIFAGILAFFLPGLTAIALLILVAVRALVVGVLEIVTAVRLRKQIQNEWLLGLAGVFSVAFGVLVLLYPGPGALALVLWIGAWAIVVGVVLLALGFRLRSWGVEHHLLGPEAHPA